MRKGMVDALHEAHRVLRPGGLLLDARPDSREPSSVQHVDGRPRDVGTVNTARETAGDDRSSDRAIARVKQERLFRSLRAGGFMHYVRFDDVPAMQAYLNDHLRLVKRARWSIGPAERRALRDEPIRIERPIRFELLERV